MPTSPNLTQTSLSDAVKTMYDRRLLERAVPRLIHGRWGEKARLNKYGSLEFRRYESLSAVTTALTEGETPTEQSAMTLTLVTATPLWYGAWIGHSDELEMTIYDPLISEVSGVLGEQAGLSVDTLIRNDVTDNASSLFSGAATSRATLDYPGDNLSFDDFLVAWATLQANNANPLDGGRFIVIVHPDTYITLMSDPTFVNLFIEAGPADDSNPLRAAFVGTILNCDIYMTANAREYADGGVGTDDAYSMLFIGRQAYGVVGIGNASPNDVDSGGPQHSNLSGAGVAASPVDVIAKQLGSAGAADPLNQRATIGWKAALDTVILNSAFIIDLEHTTVRSAA